ncbi:putative RNA polymerase sigma factor [Motilibacter rhizosphaerae]|uniref:Putative RNA polymerase sigma factor n=1 Tax=Motilibacter rhizosphaerae TaxID=598652 RepID=A0A4Q7NZB3_9ACTN|nr:DUF6596 domain-containing protein [Motilibacter rhizosphaerae]RZS91772.1 putative RNA polymerase sigma factor [Motilibacter rhizosphaerae]
MQTEEQRVEAAVREAVPRVLGALVRRHGQFAACEDAVQEALLAASAQWPRDGVPDDPAAWLLTVAGRRLVDAWRSESARVRREEQDALDVPGPVTGVDDSLPLLLLCCSPLLTPPAQLALTLRAVGGLTTAEIAAALLQPEATVAQRISRAKARLQGERFALPPAEELPERLRVVRQVVYLVFTEGHAATSGASVSRRELTADALHLARLLVALVPDDPESAGLLALLLLTDARRDARVDERGELVPLLEQDRSRWDARQIEEGVALLTRTLGTGPVGPYQLQAAIAAVHDEAATAEQTDWPQILALYDVLSRIDPGPVVALNRAVAVAMVHGPRAGLALLGELAGDERLARTHRLDAVRAHLLEQAGEREAAREAYALALRRTRNLQEQRYLAGRAAALD